MKTTNVMQLKANIKRRAHDTGVSPQLMLQNYMLERIIARLSQSKWRDSIIIKGGVLIGSLIGIDRRTTKDLDTTVHGFSLSHDSAREVFSDVCSIEVDDNLCFKLLRTEDIRENDRYSGIRVFLQARYESMVVSLSIDMTSGDRITPEAIVYDYPFVFDEGGASVMAYPLETVLAEKLETIFSRGISTTRIRDFYDIHELWRVRGNLCDLATLSNALTATCESRGSIKAVAHWRKTMERISIDKELQVQWAKYSTRHSYSKEIDYRDVCTTLCEVMGKLREW